MLGCVDGEDEGKESVRRGWAIEVTYPTLAKAKPITASDAGTSEGRGTCLVAKHWQCTDTQAVLDWLTTALVAGTYGSNIPHNSASRKRVTRQYCT